MATFHVEVTVSNLRDASRSVTLLLLVDTGATFTTLPAEIVDALGLEPIDRRQVRLGDGREERWGVGEIRIRVNEHECPSVCFMGPRGGPALLGAVTLEELGLDVDPTHKRLVPTTSYLV